MSEPRLIAGRFEVLEVLSSGVQGEELRARDRTLGREVLLVRRTAESALLGPAASERAVREARALAGLRHGSIQRLFDALADDSGPMLVLEPVAGEALAARLARDERLPVEQVLHLGLELADALAAVHAAGAVHRDICEANVILRPDGSACLTGFRLAKLASLGVGTSIQYGHGGEASAASERALLPTHPAPEQLGGESAGARTDLFALGCVLYHALTGRAAFPALMETGWSAPADPARLVPGTPPALAKLVLACLARSPVGRPQMASELLEGLRACAGASVASQGVRRTTGKNTPGKNAPGKRTPWKPAGLALAALVALTLFGWRAWPRATSATSEGQMEQPMERGLAVQNAPARPADARFAAGFRESHALLIGIGEAYRANGFAPLGNAVRDVQAVAAALEALPADRWQTTLLLDGAATYEGIRAALSTLENQLQPEDRALIYFAGHGVPHERSESSGFLVPADGQALEKDPLRTRWLHFQTLQTFLTDASAKHVLLALDCCFGGRVASMRAASAREYQERFLQSRAVVVLAAGRAHEQVSDGGAGGHSPFAEVFIEALAPRDGAITSSLIHARMLERFTDRGLPQTPVLTYPEDVAPGEFVFLLGP